MNSGLPPLLDGYHYEIRRCLIRNCDGKEDSVRHWETVKCFYSPEEVPSWSEYRDTFLYAGAYPHAELVMVRGDACRQAIYALLVAWPSTSRTRLTGF